VLLHRYEATTMAMMCGFLFGSLRKIWPFKEKLTEQTAAAMGLPIDQLEKLHKYRLGEDYLPRQLDGEVVTAIIMFFAGLAVVLLLDRVTRGHERPF
jgi:putative membrane protein